MDVLALARGEAERLIGQCMDSIREELLDIDGFCQAFDELAFQCTDCGWWCGTDELFEDDDTGDWLCRQCHED